MRIRIMHLLTLAFMGFAAAFYFLFYTSAGLTFDLRYIAKLLPGTLKIEKISGTLFSGFSLQNIIYRDSDETITAQALAVDWQPRQLLSGKLAINSLTLEKPCITLLTTNAATSINFTLDDLHFLQHLSMKQLIIRQLSFQKEDVQLVLSGTLQDNWDFQWRLQVPQLGALCKDCKGTLSTSGSIEGNRLAPIVNAHIEGSHLSIAQQTMRTLHGEAHIVVHPKMNSSISITAADLNINNNPIKKVALTLTGNIAYEQQRLITQVQIALAPKQTINIAANLPHFSGFNDAKQKIAGTIRFNFTDLSGLHYFIPVIQHPRGMITGSLSVSGLLLQPKILGTLNLTQGHAAIHALGIHLNDILLQATLDQSNIISLQGSFRSAKGTGQLQGHIDLNKANYPVALAIQGSNLNAIHLAKFKVVISPDIKLNYLYPNLELEGKIEITKAKIRLKDYISTLTLPDETVFVDQPKTEAASILTAMKLHLAISLSNDVYFNYKDFETYLGGNLVISQAPNSPAIGTGEIYAVKGKYSMYGQDLTIKTGRLIFAGNQLTNPGLNIEAIRTVKSMSENTSLSAPIMPSLENYADTTTIVGVRILGTVNNPQITLFSNPVGMTQTQILASLGGEGAALIGALSALSPGSSNIGGMTSQFTKKLGLEANIATVETFNTTTNQMQSTTSFVMGKQITKKLSLHYSIGIFNPVSIFNVRYQLNKHWAIQSETSTIDNGADILYGFERP